MKGCEGGVLRARVRKASAGSGLFWFCVHEIRGLQQHGPRCVSSYFVIPSVARKCVCDVQARARVYVPAYAPRFHQLIERRPLPHLALGFKFLMIEASREPARACDVCKILWQQQLVLSPVELD